MVAEAEAGPFLDDALRQAGRRPSSSQTVSDEGLGHFVQKLTQFGFFSSMILNVWVQNA